MLSRKALPRLESLFLGGMIVLSGPSLHAQEGGMQMPPPAVGVLELKARAVPVVNELPGRVAATRVAEVRARVSGILLERVF